MSLRAVRLRNLLLLVAVFATIVVAGSWDNRRDMQHVLDVGYPAIVQITGAQQQRLAPFAFDGWRPRFVEQGLSVDLKWDGKDGKTHEQTKVPVTEGFAATIVSGEQVRLAILSAKVVDNGSARPAINADAGARYASLQAWLTMSGYFALVSWAGFAGLAVWLGRGRTGAFTARTQTAAARTSWPPRRTFFGLAALLLGAVLVFHFWSAADAAGNEGPEISADIALAPQRAGQAEERARRSLLLSWKDSAGAVHHYGPVPISSGYWAKISRDGELAVRQARIRYRESDPMARPVLVDDPPGGSWRIDLGIASGAILVAAGVVSLFSAAYAVRRAGARQ